MRRSILVAAALFLAVGAGFAQGAGTLLMDKGTVDVNAGVGYGYGWGWGGLAIGGGAEYIVGKFMIAKEIPLTWGVAGRAGFWVGASSQLAAAALGTLHFSWSFIQWPSGLEWLNKLDSYIGLGVEILPGLGLAGIGGTSYFFTNNLAVNVESGINSSMIGIMFKL